MPLLFWMDWKETKAPPLNAPDPWLPLQVGAELIVTGVGSFSVTEMPFTLVLVTVKLELLPVGLEAFWAP